MSPFLPTCALGLAWLLCHAGTLRWLGAVALAHPSYALNLALLLCVLCALALRLRDRKSVV